MSESELAECLVTLLGFLPEGGRAELPAGREREAADQTLLDSARSAGAEHITQLLDRHLPYKIGVKHFLEQLLGLQMPQSLSAGEFPTSIETTRANLPGSAAPSAQKDRKPSAKSESDRASETHSKTATA